MSTFSKLGPRLALCCVVCGLCLIGWATRFSSAQSGGQIPPAPPPPGNKTQEPQAIASEAKAELRPAETTSPTLALPAETSIASGPAEEPASKTSPSPTSAPAPAPVVVGPDHAPLESEDPEKVANDFLEHNQKMAEAQVKALKEEAEKLKARLVKVEAGIKRWDTLLEALQKSSKAPAAIDAVKSAESERPAAGRDELKLPRASAEEAALPPAETAPKQSDAPKPTPAPPPIVPR